MADLRTHDLIEVYAAPSGYDAHAVVRWCRVCGAVVVDVDYDNRTAAGHIMRMRVPELTQQTHCRAPRR